MKERMAGGMAGGMKRGMEENMNGRMTYAELHTISNYSFLRGASHPEELVTQAAALGYTSIAITDECSLAGIVKAYVAAREHHIHLIIGSEFLLVDGTRLIILAPDRQAYGELSGLITLARRRADKGEYRLLLSDIIEHCHQGLLIWLPPTEPDTAIENTTVQDPNSQDSSSQDSNSQDHELQNSARILSKHYSNRLWLGVSLLLKDQQAQILSRLQQLSRQYAIPLVACGNVHMHCQSRKPLQDTLTAIRLNTPISRLGRKRQPNAEQYLRPLQTLEALYPPELLQETLRISRLCHFSLDELRYEYPQEVVPAGLQPDSYLRQLVETGAQRRWPAGTPIEVQTQIDKELALIKELNYEYYFLTVYDIVRFARSCNILCQGRGSAANSSVCYCLFITEVAPDKITLLFERFISKERDEPPDIDVDFEHERREEVIQYIYAKYTRERAALAATVITYRPRSAIRDVGKALGLDPLFVDHLAKSLAWWDRRGELIERFKESNISSHSQMAEHFLTLVQSIQGFPRHLSQHVGGFIITQQPISTLVPVENASMPDRTVIQWDKIDIETLGLLKVDVLGLGMLTAIRKCFALINQFIPEPAKHLNIAKLPVEDPAAYDMLCRGDSIGVFQVESRAQMSMLPRLRPRCFYDLVIEVAIVRPGPIQGDMVHPYLKRRQGIEAVTYPNDAVKAVLERTLGVPIFQEQVIKLAMVAAGFSGGEADQLRRAMASWGHNGNLSNFEEKLINGMLERGHSAEFAARVFRQMKGFGEYGFPESHAASFALLVYVSTWLKCYYPTAFCCALLNSQPMGFYSASQLIQDAKRHKASILPVEVHHSDWACTLEPDSRETSTPNADTAALRLGFRLVKGFNGAAAQRIIDARLQRPFENLQDLSHRAQLNRAEMSALVAANALQTLAGHRYQAHWQAQAIEEAKPLFQDFEQSYRHELHDQIQLEAPSEGQNLQADYASVGLTLNRHPMALLREQAPFCYCKQAQQLQQLSHGRFVRVGGLVTGRQRPGTAQGVLFLTLEDETGNLNIVVWKDLQGRFRKPLLTAKLVLIKGIMECKDGVIHIIAGEIVDYSHLIEQLALSSRDFH